MDEIAVITLVLSIWGSALSTVLGVVKLLGNRRKLDVKINIGFTTGAQIRRVLSIDGINVGKRPLNITGYSFEIVKGIPGKESLFPTGSVVHTAPKPPCTLNDGESFSLIVDSESIADSLVDNGYSGGVKLVGVLRASGKIFKSKPIDLSIALLRN
ncbi:MAG: hypothetical protein HZB92_09430 [Euryarchaeota archaeon]|nr:hypothetical protein [Euryarchaeota archaeon]